ncbi:MAG: hypothetical protein M5T61_09335 [Acidimicrobiia bacterium]|nr:hypothetical protein [Acidimicrobiia bacterium]
MTELVRDAAKEAVKIADLLVVCGFAFDPPGGGGGLEPRAPDDRACPDEPRPGDGRRAAQEDRHRQPVHGLRRARHRGPRGPPNGSASDPHLQVEIRGLDVYDPTTGQSAPPRPTTSPPGSSTPTTTATPSSSATPTSPAPMTPTTSSAAPLRADISDDAWATINSTVSRPFPRPRSGRITIKVINHYGDEVLKVIAP